MSASEPPVGSIVRDGDRIFRRVERGWVEFISSGHSVRTWEHLEGTAEVLHREPVPEPPIGSVVIDREGDPWVRRSDSWRCGEYAPHAWDELLQTFGPLRVLKVDREVSA